MPAQLFLTGASGFLGTALLQSHSAITVGRTPVPGHENIFWEISEQPILTTGTLGDHLTEGDCIVHLAWITNPRSAKTAKRNEAATEALLETARARGARFIFVSSMSADSTGNSHYGRAKWNMEELVRAYENGIVIRPGVIEGPSGFGMLDETLNKVAGLPVNISISPQPRVPLVALDRVVTEITRAIDSTDASTEIDCVDRWVSLGELVNTQRTTPAKFTVRIPQRLITFGAKAVHGLPLDPVRNPADSWLGLTRPTSP